MSNKTRLTVTCSAQGSADRFMGSWLAEAGQPARARHAYGMLSALRWLSITNRLVRQRLDGCIYSKYSGYVRRPREQTNVSTNTRLFVDTFFVDKKKKRGCMHHSRVLITASSSL